jgi:hypothetical protein
MRQLRNSDGHFCAATHLAVIFCGIMPRNILEVILAISEDKTFTPEQNLKQIGRIAKGFAPMLSEILEDYVGQNTAGPVYRVERIKAAKRMLGAR